MAWQLDETLVEIRGTLAPFRASYGVSFMSTSTEIDRVIKGFYCTK